nr:MAG TPA: Putative transcription antitermination protein nusG Regulation, Spt4, Spt5, NusG.9A [Caudoviricetes sp.]
MRCDNCPLCPIAEDDVCPECEGKYGIDADGMLGSKHPRNWAEKKSRECDEHYGTMGTDMGIEMTFTPEELAEVIDLCKHMVGLDYQKPYHRHRKAFYRPYRNYFADGIPGNRLLNKFPHWIITKSQSEKHVYYKLTADGLKWLGRQLGITIKEERD